VEFAVANIRDIEWKDSSFDNLQLPEGKKDDIRALAEFYLHRPSDYTPDFVDGKGQGGAFLLQ
jgi:hypothetical protein